MGDVRSMGYLLRIQTRCEASPRDKYEVNKAENSWKSEERFAIGHQDAEFAGFQSCFGTVFPYFLIMLPFLSFGMTICILCHYILKVWYFFSFGFTGGIELRDSLSLKRDSGCLKSIETVKDY